MKIACPIGWSRLGTKASEEQTISTAAALARAGAEVTLVAPRGPFDPTLGPEDMLVHYAVEGDFRLVQRRFAWPDHGVLPSLLWIQAAMHEPAVRASDLVLTRIPVVLGIHVRRPFVFDHYRRWPHDLAPLRGRFRRTIQGEHCLGVVAHSHYAAESYLRLPTPPEKLLVAHNGFDLGAMAPVLTRRQARRQLALPGDRPIVVYAGRLNHTKGLDQVLDMAQLKPDVLFLLVGSEGRGPIERAAEGRANVQIVPWRKPEALPPYLYAADVLLIPPSLEPSQRYGSCILPLKTFKYLAAGRPILSPRTPDIVELLRHEENALLTPPNSEAAAVALGQLLSDTALAARLGRNARRQAQTLTWDRRAQRLLEFFERRLQAARGRRSPHA